MSYVLIDQKGNVGNYPFSLWELRNMYPHVSFPANISDEALANWNVFPVVKALTPEIDLLTQDLKPGPLVNNEGIWTESCIIVSLSSDEAAKRRATALEELRIERNSRLNACDWTQLPDAPLSQEEKQAWASYRQALRDVPENTSDLLNPVWPIAPLT
jgi:hypothetical protein